jgi:hypothetical protein
VRLLLLVAAVFLATGCGESSGSSSGSSSGGGGCIYAPEGTFTITVSGDAAHTYCSTTDKSMTVDKEASQTVCTLHSSDGKLTLVVKSEAANVDAAKATCADLKQLYPS